MSTPSLHAFLTMTGAKFRLFDTGLNVQKLPEQTLSALDEGKPYLRPYLGFAWLVVLMWNPEQREQNSLWFLKLPLDEQGILSPGVHSDLVNRLYKSLEVTDDEERQKLLTEHPYQFTPEFEKMAALHAMAGMQLQQPASGYYPLAQAYFAQSNSGIEWSQLGLQGIADLVARADDNERILLSERLNNLDTPPQTALLQQFSHHSLPTKVVENILELASNNRNNARLVSACLRACAQSAARKLAMGIIEQVLEKPADIENLLVIITLYFTELNETQQIKVLDDLAATADANGFARVMTNLAMQPNQQGIVMKILTSQALTPTLANALSALIQQQRHGRAHEQH